MRIIKGRQKEAVLGIQQPVTRRLLAIKELLIAGLGLVKSRLIPAMLWRSYGDS